MTDIESNPPVETDSTSTESLPSVPPVVQGELRSPSPTRRPIWPTVIGIIGIVFGGLGIMQYCMQAVISPFAASMMRTATQISPPGQQPPLDMDDMVNSMQAQMPITIIVAVSALVLSIWLLVSSIALINRRPKCPRRLKQWSLCKIIHAVIASFAAYMMMQSQLGAMQSSMGSSAFPLATFGTVMGIVGVIFSFVFYAAYPIFLLAWFSRKKVRAEIETWTSGAREQTILK